MNSIPRLISIAVIAISPAMPQSSQKYNSHKSRPAKETPTLQESTNFILGILEGSKAIHNILQNPQTTMQLGICKFSESARVFSYETNMETPPDLTGNGPTSVTLTDVIISSNSTGDLIFTMKPNRPISTNCILTTKYKNVSGTVSKPLDHAMLILQDPGKVEKLLKAFENIQKILNINDSKF